MFPETISPHYYIFIMYEFTEMLVCVMCLITCIAIASQNREIEEENEFLGSYLGKDSYNQHKAMNKCMYMQRDIL